MSQGDRFASLRIPDYRKLWWGGMFVFLATQSQQIARGWLAFELTGSNTALGGVVFGFGVSSLIAIPAGGVLADRVPKRTILLVAQGAIMLAGLAIAVAIATDTVAYWMLVAAGAVQGAGMSLLGPARLAMTADLVDRDSLTNAIFLSNGSIQMTRVIGPAIAGALIGVATIGVGGVYFIGAGLSTLSLFFTVGLPRGEPTRRSHRSPIGDMADGIAYVRRRPELQRLLVVSLLVVMLGFPHVTFLPAMIEEIFELDAWALGLLTTSAAMGAVGSSFLLANSPRDRLPSLQARAGVLFGLTLLGFAVSPWFWLAVAVMLLVGATSSAFQALNNSLVLTIADVEYHGRVQSLIMLSFSGFGLAALPMGTLADAYGIRETMAGMALLVLASMTISFAWHRRIARPDPVAL